MTKSIFALLLMVAFTTFTATAQTADNKTNSNGNTEQVSTTQDNGTQTASSELDNCPLKGTPGCPLIKNCPKKGQSDCPYKTSASADNSTTAQNSGNGKPGCCKKGTSSCCAKK